MWKEKPRRASREHDLMSTSWRCYSQAGQEILRGGRYVPAISNGKGNRLASASLDTDFDIPGTCNRNVIPKGGPISTV